MTDRERTWIDDYMDHQRELQQKRAAWEKQLQHERDQQQRAAKQAELERYLQRRAQEWEATTGSTDGLGEQLPRWRQQFIESKVAEQEAERQARRDAAATQYPH